MPVRILYFSFSCKPKITKLGSDFRVSVHRMTLFCLPKNLFNSTFFCREALFILQYKAWKLLFFSKSDGTVLLCGAVYHAWQGCSNFQVEVCLTLAWSPRIVGWGFAARFPKILLCLWPKSEFPSLFMTWQKIWYPIYDRCGWHSCPKHNIVEDFCYGLIDNDEKVASSKRHTQFKTRVQQPYPIYICYDQNGQNRYPINDQNSWKTIPFRAAHTFIAHTREYPASVKWDIKLLKLFCIIFMWSFLVFSVVLKNNLKSTLKTSCLWYELGSHIFCIVSNWVNKPLQTRLQMLNFEITRKCSYKLKDKP